MGGATDGDGSQAEDEKEAGNLAYARGEYEVAVGRYTTALGASKEPDFRVVVLCNRAAALNSLERYSEALVDC